jgi:xyloglucan-specific exo-beta-1,4-glucanase
VGPAPGAVDPAARLGRLGPAGLAAPSGNGLWRSTDHGATWARVTAFPNAGNFVPDPNDTSGYASDNLGVLWVVFDPRTPGRRRRATRTIHVGVADRLQRADRRPAESRHARGRHTSAQIGGVRGIFRSDDGGRTWVRINDDRHRYAWTGAAITGDPRVYARVYIATNGRGIIVGQPC